MAITRNPTPVDVGTSTTTIPLSQIDRAPAAVSTSADPALAPSTATVSRPVSTLPSLANVTTNTSTTTEITVDTNTLTNISVPQPLYLSVSDEGTVVLSRTNSINFVGSGVSVTNTNGVATVDISGGGGGSYGNSNVVSLLSSFGSNTLSTTGNVTAGYLFGNGSQLTGIVSSYGNSNVSVYLASGTNSANIVTTANVSGANLITSGIVSATGNVRGANINTAGIVSATGNITGNYFIGNGLYGTSTNDTAVLGNASGLIRVLVQDNGVNIQTYDHPNLNYHSWTFNSAGDLYLPDGNVGIYYANGQPYGGGSTGNVGFDNNNIYNTQGGGLILSNFNFVTDEAETAYVQIPAGNSTSDLNVVQEQGNVRLVANTAAWNFDTTGNLTIPNGGYINFVNTGGITQAVNEDLRFTVSDNEEDGWAVQSTVNDGAGNDLTRMQVRYDGVRINTDIPTNNYSFDFRDTGEFDVPKSIRGPVGGNLVISIGDQFGAGPTFIDLQTRSYVGDALISNIRIGDPNVTISTSSGAQNWTFGSTGTITLPNGGNIRSVDELTVINSTTTANGIVGINAREQSTGDSVAQIYLDGTDRVARVSTYNPDTEIGYDWTFDAGGSFTLPTSPGNVYFGTNTNGPVIIADSLGITLNANRADTTQDYITASQDGVNIFSVNTINIENDTTGFLNSDININSGDDIFLRGRDKPDDSESEGGDINIWAGDGASSTGVSNDTGGGGDIQILGGLGGSGTGTGVGASSGGVVSISGGDGGTSVDSNAGSGGSLTLSAGSAAGTANTALGGIGGSISISAGQTTRINEIGGSISLNTGAASGDGTSPAGYLEINIPSSNVGPGGTWTFSGVGNELNVPGNSAIYGANFGNFTVGCAGNTIVTSSDYGANVQNWVFGYTGTLTFPSLANISGGNFNAGTASATVALNAFSPDGNTVSIQAQGNTSSAVISIFANSGPVTNNWTFTQAPLDPTEAFLYVPPGGAISTPDATGGEGGKNIRILAGTSDPDIWNSNPGGELYIQGGYGSFGDGGGGAGGNVNINGGESSDSHAGNVNITAGAFRYWSFDYTGNLNLPPSGNIVGLTANNSGYLNWFGNSSGDGNGYTTLRLVPDDTRENADQYLIIDPTAPGHIHIRAGGTQDNSGADLILGGENSYFKVAAGSNSVATIASNSNVWTFGTDGSLAVPGPMSLAVYANATVRDSSITSPTPGMMIYVTGTGMQVRGATQWNTVAGTGT